MSQESAVLEIPTEYSKKIIQDLIERHKIKNCKISVESPMKYGDNYLSDIFRINRTRHIEHIEQEFIFYP